jgi:hypothetical protein
MKEPDEGQLRLVRTSSVVERTAGALKSRKPPLTAEELRQASEWVIAQEAAGRTDNQGNGPEETP